MLRLLRKPTQSQRSRLFKFFIRNFDLSKETICLDIGGVTEGFESLSKLCTAIIVNLEVRKKVNGWDLILADGRYLPVKGESIDIVMSNALLEHVTEGRQRLVQEIRRVSKGNLFVSVPYVYSPIEPHYFIPFFQFVPESVKRFLLFKLGLKIGWMNKENYAEITLFRKSQLKRLFPKAQIYTLKVYSLPVNLIAISKNSMPVKFI
jgi:SAM-dependent methyltransferase